MLCRHLVEPQQTTKAAEAIRLYSSRVRTKLRELQERDLSAGRRGVSVPDRPSMVVALGITLTGEKRFLGFVETDTEPRY